MRAKEENQFKTIKMKSRKPKKRVNPSSSCIVRYNRFICYVGTFQIYNNQKITLLMLHQANQDIFDVLDLGDSYSWSTSLHYHQKDSHIDFQEYYDNLQDVKQKIQELPATNQTQDLNQDDPNDEEDPFSEQSYQCTQNSLAVTLSSPSQELIQFSEQKIKERNVVFCGYDYETQNLGKHLKFSTSSYLNLLIKSRDLDPQEQAAANEFAASNGSLQNFRRLFQIQSLSQKCREYYESTFFVQTIMGSARMEMRSKLAMLRHIEKFRRMTYQDPVNWKMDYS